MEEKRNSVGKVLACLLLCSKGGCTIRKLENDYRNEEGHSIPYQEFGCISAIDFFRTIPGHVRLVYEGGQYLVYPVVTEKTRHVKDLVARQRASKGSSRRKSLRPSKYYPSTSTPRSFVPFKVQRSVAHMLTANPSGVSRSRVADQLQQSRSIAGTVNVDNVDEFVSGMPHTAVSSGNKIYPSRSLGARPRSAQRGQEEFGGFDVVSPKKSETQNPSEQYAAALPAGSEEAEDLCEPQTYDGESRYLSYDVRAKKNAGCSNESKGRMSSAEFIDKAAGLQYTEVAGESGNREGTGPAVEVERYVEEEEEIIDPDCTYVSDDEKSVEIIGSRMKARLENLIQKHPDGIWCADLVEAYSAEYKLRFDFKDYGFSSVSEFASQLKDIFHLVRLNARGDFKLYDAKRPVPQSESRPAPRPMNPEWRDDSDDDNANPLPLQVESKESLRLVPPDVMAYGESVGQVRIPAVSEGPDYSNIEVYVSEVYTPSLFWIHLRKKRAKLEQFMASLHDFYEQQGDNYTIPLVVLAKGLNCVCTFQDKWHRAIIKNVKPNGDVTLIFYDYGTTQTYPPDSVRYLTRTYSDLPAQAIACGLYNIRPINCDAWTIGASTAFYNKVDDLPLIAMVIKVDRENNSMQVSLVDTQGEVDFHVNDWMVRQGLAEIGSLVRSRPSNFVLRHCVACLKYQNDRKLMNERQLGTISERTETVFKNVARSESATSSGSDVKLKSTDRLKNFMAKYSKYRKGDNDTVPKCVATQATNLSSETSARVDEGCSSNGINALQTNSPSDSIREPNASKRSFVFLNRNRQNTVKNIASTLTRTKELSENNNLPEASGAKQSETPALPYSGTFRSFFGGQDNLPSIDWSKLRSDLAISEESVDQKEKTVESLPQKETGGISGDYRRTAKCSDDLLSETSHYKMVSNNGKGDSVDLEARYYEDQAQPQVQKVVTTQAANVPLITPQSTLPDSGTLRPPPGFTIPSETTNYAAMMDENLRSRNYSYSNTESSNLFNYCNFSVNNHPSPSATALYNVLSMAPEAVVQFWHQQLAAALNQFLLTNNSTSTGVNSTLNTTDVETPSSIVQEKTSLFQSCQDRELLSTSNLNTSEFDTNNYSNSTTLLQPSEREQNVTNGDLNLLDLDDEIWTETADGDIDELSVRLHDSNPFKQYIIGGDSSPVETNNNTLKVPPIPPRNPSSIKTNVNLATTKIPDVNPSPRIYYTGEPVMYKLRDEGKRRDEETSKIEKPVSSGGNKNHGIINSSDKVTNHSLGGNTLPEIGKENPFTPVRKVSINGRQFLSPRISPSTYRPPPPPYNGNCKETRKTVISPRYPSPLASGDSRALSEDIQLPTLDLFNKLESAAPENPGLEKLKNSGSFEEATSSFSTSNITESVATPESSRFRFKSATEPKKEYKIKLIIPKSLHQGEKSLDNQTKVLSETLGITPRFEEPQGFNQREPSSSMKRLNGQTDHPHSDASKYAEEPRGTSVNPFDQTETQNREKSWKRATVEQQPLARTQKENSGVSYNGGITKDFNHSGFSTSTKPMHESPIVSPQPYQSRPLYYPPMYPHHLVPQQIHPVPLPMQFGQQMPLHRPNMPGYFTQLPPWVRPQLYNAAYSQATAHPHQPPMHPNFWSHNPMFSTQQPAGVSHRAGENEGQQKSKMDVDQSDSTPKVNGSSSHLANSGVAQKRIEKRDEEVTSFVEEAKEEKNLEAEGSSSSSSEESIIDIVENGFTENVPVVEPVKIFKPIEVHKQIIHIFNIDHQGWVSTDEIVQVFLPTETRNIVLRMLRMLNVRIDFLEISRAQSPDLFAQLDDSSIRLPRMTNSQRIRGALHLTPIQLLYRMMTALRVISDQDVEGSKKQKPLPGSNLAELVKLVLAYRSDDAYWA